MTTEAVQMRRSAIQLLIAIREREGKPKLSQMTLALIFEVTKRTIQGDFEALRDEGRIG